MMNRSNLIAPLCLYIISHFGVQSTFAQKSEIFGVVRDSLEQVPVEGCVVQVLDENKQMVAFSITNRVGEYKVSFEASKSPSWVLFRHVSYTQKITGIENGAKQMDMFLTPGTTILREVLVRAPDIILRQDTISYNVTAFQQEADRTIEDVLRRMPGIGIAEDGKISYQGINISRFSIEGLDMLGGKYTLASRRVEAKDVERVEMTENYQEIKQLEGKEYSDKVALNLKLKKEAKMRLLGNAELGGGGRENEALYHGALTGMTFASKMQLIGTLKANSLGSQLLGETKDHFESAYTYNIANALIRDNLASYPSLSFERFHQKDDFMSSLNSVLKLSEGETVRMNIDYNRERSRFDYQTLSTYRMDDSCLVISEIHSPGFLVNALKGALKYQLNTPKTYINNSVHFYLRNVDSQFGIITNSCPIGQDKMSKIVSIKNDFSFLKRVQKKQYNFNSAINYSYSPNNRTTFVNIPSAVGDYYQIGSGKSLSTSNRTSFSYDISRVSQLSLMLSFNAQYDDVCTLLLKNDSTISNKNNGYKFTLTASPEYRFLSFDQRYGFTWGVPFTAYILNYKNRINSDFNYKGNYILTNSRFNVHYKFSAFAKLNWNSSFTNNIGDIADFVVNPIQQSYQQRSGKIGLLSANQNFSSSIRYEYKNPLNMLLGNGSLIYGRTRNNIIASQTVATGNGETDISSLGIEAKNISQSISGSGSVDKKIKTIATTFSLNTTYQVATGHWVRQGVQMNVRTNSFFISPRIQTQAIKKMSLNYHMNYNQLTQTYCQPLQDTEGLYAVFYQQSHFLSVDYNLLKGLLLHASMNFNRRKISERNYVNMHFLNLSAKYDYKKIGVELSLNNLLNAREYSYTIPNNGDISSYVYYLNPCEIILMCRFSL